MINGLVSETLEIAHEKIFFVIFVSHLLIACVFHGRKATIKRLIEEEFERLELGAADAYVEAGWTDASGTSYVRLTLSEEQKKNPLFDYGFDSRDLDEVLDILIDLRDEGYFTVEVREPDKIVFGTLFVYYHC